MICCSRGMEEACVREGGGGEVTHSTFHKDGKGDSNHLPACSMMQFHNDRKARCETRNVVN